MKRDLRTLHLSGLVKAEVHALMAARVEHSGRDWTSMSTTMSEAAKVLEVAAAQEWCFDLSCTFHDGVSFRVLRKLGERERRVPRLRRRAAPGKDGDPVSPPYTPDEMARDLANHVAGSVAAKDAEIARLTKELAETEAARAREVCETCRFAGAIKEHLPVARPCQFLDMSYITEERVLETLVPLAINGQPFGCRGWQAKQDGR